MKVLVIGSGGREHAIVWKMAQSKEVDKIFVAPGNSGMNDLAECVDLSVSDIDGLLDFAKCEAIDLTVVGPELPLTLGIVDLFEKNDLLCFGPTQACAQIEGSKTFSKNLMKKYNIPTAEYGTFTDYNEAKDFAGKLGLPCVIKADGLAAGKGVVICESQEDIENTLKDMLLDNKFGESGNRVVVEEFLSGQEVSILAFADGDHVLPMVSAQDHKRIFDGDLGANTGGMGAYSPASIYTEELAENVVKNIIQPTIQAMKNEGSPFTGILYTGLILTEKGPKVLEYNARFGDPETQPVLMRLESDLYEVIMACMEKRLDSVSLDWSEDAAVSVVLAAGGYPESPEKGKVIKGLDGVFSDHTVVFHAGTIAKDGKILTNGGRVLNVTSRGKTIEEAIEHVYQSVANISFENMQFRKDIGAKAIQ